MTRRRLVALALFILFILVAVVFLAAVHHHRNRTIGEGASTTSRSVSD